MRVSGRSTGWRQPVTGTNFPVTCRVTVMHAVAWLFGSRVSCSLPDTRVVAQALVPSGVAC